MEYQDFILEITVGRDAYKISARTEGQEGREAFRMPVDGIASQIQELEDKLKCAIYDTRCRRVVDVQQNLAATLSRKLFVGDIGEILRSHLRDQNCGLRIRFEFDPDDDEESVFAALPWELLHQDNQALARCRQTPVTRYPRSSTPRPSLVHGDTLRILAVSSLPSDHLDLDIQTELRKITDVVKDCDGIGIDLYEDHPNPAELRRLLIDGGYHVLHFMGHGGFTPKSERGALFFVDEQGQGNCVFGKIFAEFMKDIETLQLIVLSSCYGAAVPRRRGRSVYASIAPALSLIGVPAVVAMQFVISDHGAATFSKSFYRALSSGDPIDVAVGEGRLALSADRKSHPEWATPALYSRAPDCVLFSSAIKGRKIPVQSIKSIRDKGKPKPPSRLRLLIRSFHGWRSGEEDRLLALESAFDDRFIRDDALWHDDVFPRLDKFLKIAAADNPSLHLDFAAHGSIAFAAGYVLEVKSGVDLTISQRGKHGMSIWDADAQQAADGPLWEVGDHLAGDGVDVAIAVSVTHKIADEVQEYFDQSGLSVSRIVPVSIVPEPGQMSVNNGTHALLLAHELAKIIRNRTIKERKGTLHLFVAAPNVITFFLGQLAKSFGKVIFYEYPFGSGEIGAYRPGISLPPPK